MADKRKSGEPRLDDHPGDGVSRGTGRMEAFADAVFAITFTLPVVEIVVPDGGGDYGRQLVELWPSYLGYVLGSFIIGIYWVHHHFSGAIYRTTGHFFNLATIVFLATIGFVAFPARAFAEHVQEPSAREAGAIFLCFALAATATAWLVKWTVGRRSGHVDERLDAAYVDRLDRMYRRSTVATVLAALLSLVWWPAGLAVAFGILAYYLNSPETPVYTTDAPQVAEQE